MTTSNNNNYNKIPRIKTINNPLKNDEETAPLTIPPRKPPNPCLESSARKELHKELLWNQRVGTSPLKSSKKSELQKAIEKMKEKNVVIEPIKTTETSEFERVLNERREKVDNAMDTKKDDDEDEEEDEFLRVFKRVNKK